SFNEVARPHRKHRPIYPITPLARRPRVTTAKNGLQASCFVFISHYCRKELALSANNKLRHGRLFVLLTKAIFTRKASACQRNPYVQPQSETIPDQKIPPSSGRRESLSARGGISLAEARARPVPHAHAGCRRDPGLPALQGGVQRQKR